MGSTPKDIQLDLPDIPKLKKIVPNDFVRSALFTVANHRTQRKYSNALEIYSYNSSSITYTGEELRQEDEDVWLQLISLASEAKSSMIEIAPYTFLSSIGWPQRVHYRDRLKSCLVRLAATNLSVVNKEFQEGLDLSLVRKFSWEGGGKSKEWRVWLEPEVIRLFSKLGQTYTKLEWEQRIKLRPLAKWLHAFYSTHKHPYPISLEILRKLTGSKSKTFKHFKSNIREALVELVQVGFIKPTYYIDKENFLYLERVLRKSNLVTIDE